MGAFFSTLWAIIKNAPTIIATIAKLKAAWEKFWLAQNQAKQDKIVQDLKDAAKKAIEEKDQRELQNKISGEDGGLPAQDREGVTEHDSDDRIARQAARSKI